MKESKSLMKIACPCMAPRAVCPAMPNSALPPPLVSLQGPGRAAIAHAVHALPLQSSQASDLSTVGNELIAHLIRWEKYSWQACVLIFTLRTLFWGHSIYNAAS
ncbi:unnamed protein product [Fusarium graminearum]|nr:unnamed protein product [Fusarium graminearum]VTO90034.1 unnamed protein product [Fusarium graminearum]